MPVDCSDLPEAAVASNSNVLEPVLIEGEYPGETIEVVDATDDMWAPPAPAAAEPVINVERKKTENIHRHHSARWPIPSTSRNAD